MMSKPRVAIIGLGIMGGGMAGRLLSAGFPLAVYNRNKDRSAPFASAGATVAASAREAASGADIIISMVSDDIASRGV
jgi:3-hydroxyisobutyrate dehydrogenase